jgi:hypothetical protein
VNVEKSSLALALARGWWRWRWHLQNTGCMEGGATQRERTECTSREGGGGRRARDAVGCVYPHWYRVGWKSNLGWNAFGADPKFFRPKIFPTQNFSDPKYFTRPSKVLVSIKSFQNFCVPPPPLLFVLSLFCVIILR